MGAVTPYGCGTEKLWNALLEKRSAISEMDLFDLGGIACTKAGVIRNFTPPEGFEDSPRATAFAAAACIEALQQAGIYDNPEELQQTTLITASNFGNIDQGEQALIPPDNPDYAPEKSINCAHFNTADILAERLNLQGLRISLSLSCASGASAAVTAANLISEGHAKRVLIVSYDALSRFSWSGLCALRTMTKEILRPFDKNRSGTIFTEGAAALILDAEADAEHSLAYLTGWASGNNGHHMTAPAPRGAGSAYVMKESLKSAGIAPEKIDHINTHGTGTKPNDVTEAESIQDSFGASAATIPATSIKGSLGHMLGAAGSMDLITSVLSLRNNLIPPTANLQEQDPECELNVITEPYQTELKNILSNSAGFGGCNAALVISNEPASPTETEKKRKVYITGFSLISALGYDSEETLAALKENESACFPLERFEQPGVEEPPNVGEVHDLEITDFGVSRKPYLDDASRLFLCACGAAIEDAGYNAKILTELNAGIMAGTAWGCGSTQQMFFADFINKGPRLVKPFIFPHSYANTAISLASMEWSLKGVHDNITTPHTASGIAFIEAYETIRDGHSNCILTVGCDALSIPRLQAVPPCQPQGEAAAAVILESNGEVARAEVIGCGIATKPEAAINAALVNAELKASEIKTVTSLEDISGDLAGAATVAELSAAIIRGLSGPTLITTSEESTAVAIIVKPV